MLRYLTPDAARSTVALTSGMAQAGLGVERMSLAETRLRNIRQVCCRRLNEQNNNAQAVR